MVIMLLLKKNYWIKLLIPYHKPRYLHSFRKYALMNYPGGGNMKKLMNSLKPEDVKPEKYSALN